MLHYIVQKVRSNDVFQAVFSRTGLGNTLPRAIRYRKYSGGFWNSSTQRSDDAIIPTGLQGASVVEMNTGLAAFAYAGNGSVQCLF